ncbi:hypothetical protein S7711_01815 [Stachybotrys chartarum IBT 7711]|uniref:Ribosomal RNA methyltransferase FtsJ domain-containing protein n=1 Tax=Stachybotrys chartarum (strain CBS 109288 / IBT 7711) TaxID=1280523 RepID=A0A084AJ20_STACB|nr:hypothetical protein S7711_01815 [Stachybotrys chartarum IBT 7711]
MSVSDTTSAGMEEDRQDNEGADQASSREPDARKIVNSYITKQNVVHFIKLQELREKGWQNPEADTVFAKQRNVADKPSEATAAHFFRLMKDIAADMTRSCGAFDLSRVEGPSTVLDTCFAPGGFAQYLLDEGHVSSIKAFTLPPDIGGHKIFAKDPKLHVEEIDVTMLAGEMGLTAADVPPSHPDAANFVYKNMIDECEKFDLVICDGMVLRTHTRHLYRESSEGCRLSSVQFYMALQHIKAGGTMVVLLHKPEAFYNVKLMHRFSQFSQVTLFKPKRAHAHRSSFYMVAKNIQPDHDAVTEILTNCKETWRVATFGTEEEFRAFVWHRPEDAQALMEVFGERFIGLAKKVWRIQCHALAKKSWTV